ncbi:MAG TPA: ATP-binding protein [Coleofasciculaceae cyanobacterium]|jgi:signal transduction histidine kinase/FixJ family two-component response regulator
MDTVSLRDFLIDVPACPVTESLSQVWQIFQQTNCSRIVVVDGQQIALGTLSLHHFMPYGLKQQASDHSQQSIQTLLNSKATKSLLEPIASFPTQATLRQLQPYLDRASQQNWGLVDDQGRYVGLLDRLALLQRLATDPHLASGQPDAQPEPECFSSVPLLDPLVDLLERLPIPLMLQTSTGQIITQNWVWRRQVGELADPGQIRQEAALILETIASTEEYTAVSSRYPSADAALAQRHADSSELPGFYTGSWDHASSLLEGSRYSGACRLSAEAGACVCTCPMKSGQERVWQFVKISMGTVPSQFNTLAQDASAGFSDLLTASDVATSDASSETSSLFKLATLNFHPDPEWRSLMQTESLWLVLAQDMTEQHQVAKELSAKNADLVQLNRLKDEFLACISHELKTPLTAVLGLSSLLKDKMLGELNDRQSRYAQLIHQSSRHLVLIINNILDLTQIETGQLDLSLHPVEIETLCARAYEQACQIQVVEASGKTQDEKAKTAAEFSLDIKPGIDLLIADELRLRQMLTNLLSNAIKFTEVGGKIGLKVEAWEGWIAFTVWDTGIGIPADKQHLIFQKFQQLENPLTRRFDGTGLGLVLTQRLARMHGGDVTFISQEGRGSEFTLLLPPCPPQAVRSSQTSRIIESSLEGSLEGSAGADSAIAHRSSHDPTTPKAAGIQPAQITTTSDNHLVLVVEAAPKAIENLTHHLTGLGYRVAIARSGTEALEKARRLQPCAIFLNPSLPLLSGWDVLTLLKVDDTTRQIPTVVTAMRMEKKLAYQNGADGFLSQPVEAIDLERCLERAIRPKTSTAETTNLTVLHLREHSLEQEKSGRDVNQLLHPYQYRVLEVDDLEQAELLARVWHPDVVIIDGTFTNPLALMKQFSQSLFLAALPLVTLTAEMTQAANQVSGLSVFPCFAEVGASDAAIANAASWGDSHLQAPAVTSQESTLLQVIQIAAGIQWKPNILIADFTTLEADWLEVAHAAESNLGAIAPSSEAIARVKAPSGLQALVQYIHTAGFRSSVGSSWRSVLRQLQYQSVDLLLFYVHSAEPHPLFDRIARDLQKLEVKPPILVWHCHAYSATATEAEIKAFNTHWGSIATQVLPPCVEMSSLLAEINHTLAQVKREKRG